MPQYRDLHIFDCYMLVSVSTLDSRHIQACRSADFLGTQEYKNILIGHLIVGTDCLVHMAMDCMD